MSCHTGQTRLHVSLQNCLLNIVCCYHLICTCCVSTQGSKAHCRHLAVRGGIDSMVKVMGYQLGNCMGICSKLIVVPSYTLQVGSQPNSNGQVHQVKRRLSYVPILMWPFTVLPNYSTHMFSAPVKPRIHKKSLIALVVICIRTLNSPILFP